MINQADVIAYIHSHFPKGVHISMALPKEEYTQEEANQYFSDALRAWEIIEKLRK